MDSRRSGDGRTGRFERETVPARVRTVEQAQPMPYARNPGHRPRRAVDGDDVAEHAAPERVGHARCPQQGRVERGVEQRAVGVERAVGDQQGKVTAAAGQA
jgi:hypothetical protein